MNRSIAQLSKEAFSTSHVGHLGLVADKIDSLGLIDLIDQRLPLKKAHGVKVTQGERVAAMILNGLGFTDNRLYIFPKFLKEKPIERLFNKPLKAQWFNDDALGRCLDAIAAYGCTKLFTEISLSIGKKRALLGKSFHLDATTLTLYGEDYKGQSSCENEPVPAKGYAKSGRHDLKQMILLLATTGAANFPVWMQAHSGNASDKKTLPSAAMKLRELCEGLKSSEEFIYVGDSAIYSNILEYSEKMRWITRVPQNIKQAKEWVSSEEKEMNWKAVDENYRYAEREIVYGGVKQRWILFHSEAAYQREIKTLEKRLEKVTETEKKAWWHLSHHVFTCEKDALAEIKAQRKKLTLHTVKADVVEVRKHKAAGRPKADAVGEVAGYQICYELALDEKKIGRLRATKGRFILGTNLLSETKLASADVLKEYKAQSGVERGFKFIKNKAFQVDSVFLKTPKRIEALMVVMTLCLMVYGVTEYELRASLKAKNEAIPNQIDKPTQRPSLQWVYFLFRGVNELQITIAGYIRKQIVNLNDVLIQIIGHFGERARYVYFNSS